MEFSAYRVVTPSRMLVTCLCLSALGTSPGSLVAHAATSTPYRVDALHALPLSFERNGEAFIGRTSRYSIQLQPQQLTFTLRERDDQAPSRKVTSMRGATARTLSVRLLQSNPRSVGMPEDPLPAKANYLIGNDPARWRTDVSLFGRVRFPLIYKDVDVVYYGNQQQLEYDFVIHPGGDAQAIRFTPREANRATIAPGGDLVVEVGKQQAVLHRPLAYQIVDGRRRLIAARFRSFGQNRFGLQVGQYDHELPLTIDPVLTYSTYLGGSDDEGIFGIGFDEHGNLFVAGETSSLNFPQKDGVQNHLGGDYDVFISKFDPQGAHLIYSTYLGGAKYDHAVGLQVDKEGNAYVAGITQSTDFPVKNAWQSSLSGTLNGFIAKLSPSGSELLFSTYLGGNSVDVISALSVDRAGSVYVAGYTDSNNFPTTPHAFQSQCDQGAHPSFCSGDAFVTRLTPSGSNLIYSTYLGGTNYDSAAGIAIDKLGDAYIAGQTSSTDFPTKAPYQSTLMGPANAFVVALNPDGSGLKLSTFLGGNGFDGATDIALDSHQNIYVTGTTSSTNFPVFRAFQATFNGGISDGFVTKFNPQASRLVYSTYYGGTGWDYPYRIAVNRREEAALIGFTSSTDFPVQHALSPDYRGGATDAFVVLFDREGQYPVLSTYLGGTGDEYGYAVQFGCHDSIWVGGSTSSTDFPQVRAFQSHYAGGPYDAFLSEITVDDDSPETESGALLSGAAPEMQEHPACR